MLDSWVLTDPFSLFPEGLSFAHYRAITKVSQRVRRLESQLQRSREGELYNSIYAK